MNIPSKKQKNPGLTAATMEIPSKKQKNPGIVAPAEDECADDSECTDGLTCIVNASGTASCEPDALDARPGR